MTLKTFLKPLLGVAALLVLATGVVGFAHTPPGRPLLALMGMGKARTGGGMCPLGYDVAASPAQKESARQRFSEAHRGEASAKARPALGFVLDQTTESEVLQWATAHDVQCSKPKSGADLDCVDVPAAVVGLGSKAPALRNLWLNFGEGARLRSVIAIRREPDVKAIGSAFDAMVEAVSQQAGPPAKVDGDGSPQRLSEGLLRQSSVEYRFTNYYALARATNMGDAFLLTEEYRSLVN